MTLPNRQHWEMGGQSDKVQALKARY